ncbi:hypothetical protein PG984_010253 [Apiospora sp. TS-2023a]
MAAPNGTGVLFSEATSITRLDANTYKCFLNDAYCVGSVPNGGYAGSCMLAAARVHLTPRGQPDTLTAHFEFPNRTFAGPAVISVDEVNTGKQLSRLHLTLWQGNLLSQAPWIDPKSSRRTAQTPPRFPPLPDFEALKSSGSDGTWEEPEIPKHVSTLMRSLQNWHFYIPQKDPFTPGAVLAYVVDSFPYNMHTFLAAPEIRQLLQAQPDQEVETEEKRARRTEVKERDEGRAALWFPTVVMNLEAKAALPVEGVEWLAVRVTSKQIKDGRFDLDVLVRDAEGEIVALSQHVAMIVSVERNTKKRGSSSKAVL